MFPFWKKNKNKKPMPQWMLWLVVAFVIYAVITNPNEHVAPTTENESANPEKSENLPAAPVVKQTQTSSFFDPSNMLDLEGLGGKFFPEATIKLNFKDIEEGQEHFVTCGQKVTVNYTSFLTEDSDKKPIESDKKISYTVGEGKAIPALEKAILGMHKGGKRTITSPGYLAYGAEGYTRDDVPVKADIRFETELLDITPLAPFSPAYRVIGDSFGDKNPYNCSSQTKLNISIWDVTGKKLYDSKDRGAPLSFIIGKSEVFYGLEYGVMQMSPGMRRNLIVPPVMQKTLSGNQPLINFPLPNNQTVLVDVEALP